jgi:hypothetical protein
MDREYAKIEVGNLLGTHRGQSLAHGEILEMIMQATRDANPIEAVSFVGQMLAKFAKNADRSGVIDWVKMLELLKRKLAKQ